MEEDKKKCTDDRKRETEGNKGDLKKTGDSPGVRLADKPSNEVTNVKATEKTAQESTDKGNEPGIKTSKTDQGTNKTVLPDKVDHDTSKTNLTDKKDSQTANVKLKDKGAVEKTSDKSDKNDSTIVNSPGLGKTNTPQQTDKPDSRATDKTGSTGKPTDKTDNTGKSTDKSESSSKPTDVTDSSGKPTDKTGITDKPSKADNLKLTENTGKSTDKADNTAKSTDKADDSVKSTDKADNTAKSTDKADDSVKSTDKADNTAKSTDKADDSVKSTDNADNSETNKTRNAEVAGVKAVKDTAAEDTQENGTQDDAKQRLISKEDEKETRGASDKQTDVVPSRWIFAVLGCIGFMIVYGLKVNLSVAIIAMVNHTAVAEMAAANDHHDDHHGEVVLDDESAGNVTAKAAVNECGVEAKEENLEDGPFAWDENVQGLILASYFYGYLFTQVPGGWVAEKFSAKHVFGVGALVNAICALLTPVAASASYAWLIVIRIIMGIAGGVTLPGMHVLIAKWAPPQERSKIASSVYAGMTLGTLVCMPFSGLLAAAVDWSAVFYVQGGLSLLWYVLWLIFVFDSPSQHPRIARAERKFIEESLGTVVKTEKPPVPWKSIWTSLPMWAIICAHTTSNWGWYMLLVKLPTYMRYILKFDIKSNAGLSAVPFLCMWIFTMILANILDTLRSRKIISTTFARKFSTLTATILPAICLIAVTYVGCNTDLAVALLTLGTMFVGGMYSGFLSNHIDIAPSFAGTLMGITNTFATFPGIIVPSFVGYMTHGNQTVEAWRTIFFITLGIYSFGATFFTIFGSGELQEWAKPKTKAQDEGEQQKLNDVA